jgi:hypothetical protein
MACRRSRSCDRHRARSISPRATCCSWWVARAASAAWPSRFAARAGARILAPALAEDETFLRELGVSDVPPRDGEIPELVRERHPDGVDALLDLVNYGPLGDPS